MVCPNNHVAYIPKEPKEQNNNGQNRQTITKTSSRERETLKVMVSSRKTFSCDWFVFIIGHESESKT